MKATLTFDLPEDQEAYELHLHASRFERVLQEFARYLRDQVKYHEPEDRDDIERVKECFYEILDEARVEI